MRGSTLLAGTTSSVYWQMVFVKLAAKRRIQDLRNTDSVVSVCDKGDPT